MRAMILAAGFGERMRPLTEHTPKPLLPVAGKPLLDYHLEKLARCGVRDVVINHSWLGEQIVAHCGSGQRYGLSLHYSAEATPLETLGGIMQALPLLGEQFIVVNGDIFCDYDFAQLHLPSDALAQLVLVDNPPQHPHGDFALNADRCCTNGEPRFTFAGIACYRAAFFTGCMPGKAPLAPLLRAQMAHQVVAGQRFTGFWSDIGTPQRLQECDRFIRQRESA